MKKKKQSKKPAKKNVRKKTAIVKIDIKKIQRENKELEKQLETLKGKGGKLTLTESPFVKNQLLRILQRTPKEYIRQRKGKGGKDFKYVTGNYVKKSLNYIFSWMWDSEVIYSENIVIDGKIVQIIVDVKLTIKTWNEKTGQVETLITKTQTGRADVKYLKNDPKTPVDFGNDRKAAITDGIKKCASELGLASDVYAENEYKEIKNDPPVKNVTPEKEEKPQVDKKGKLILPEKITEKTLCNVKGYNVPFGKLNNDKIIYLYMNASNPESIELILHGRLDRLVKEYIEVLNDYTFKDLQIWIDAQPKIKDKKNLTIKEKMNVIDILKKQYERQKNGK
jgi:hypothetical protein